MEKKRIKLKVLLPQVPDQEDACVARLMGAVKKEAGVREVHLVEGSDHQQELCFHYDPEVLDLNQLEKLARSTGAKLTEKYGHLILPVTGIRQPRQARRLEEALNQQPGILAASISGNGFVRLEYDHTLVSDGKARSMIENLGLAIRPDGSTSKAEAHQDDHDHDHNHEHEGHDHTHGHDHAHGGIFGERTELIFSLICGAFLALGFGLHFISGLPFIVPYLCYGLAYFFGGFYTTIEAVQAITKGQFEIDFLMLVAAAGAAILGDWAEGSLLLFLFSFGHALEHFAMEKARKSISALAGLAPKTALKKSGNDVQEVPIASLEPGDIIVVRPNTKIAADGIVVDGQAAVNQAPITGESIPVDKEPYPTDPAQANLDQLDARYRVFAGSINGAGALEIYVSKKANDSSIARLVKLVNEAQTQKSPTQHFTDKFEKYFVPFVLVMVTLLCFAFLVRDELFSASFYRAMAVLVASSPCALAISTPSAVLSGVARAARAGVLIKGGKPLEDLGKLTAVAFDKTGTLTEGKPKLTSVSALNGLSEKEILRIAVAVESLSDHPIARAIVRDGLQKLGSVQAYHADQLHSVTGKGLEAVIGKDQVRMGNLALFDAGVPDEVVKQVHKLEDQGNTTMILQRNADFIGILAVMDTPRAEAREVIETLRETGIRKMIMLTGDHQKVADSVAADIGLSEAHGGLLPEQKVDLVMKLRSDNKAIAMVGDGVNDAPAMANSTVGIAMGAAGSDVALETADIALMGDQLSLLPFAIGLSRKARRIITQNLFISLGMVALLIPLTISGLATMGPAVIGHEGSTLVVVLNALRLLAYKDPAKKPR